MNPLANIKRVFLCGDTHGFNDHGKLLRKNTRNLTKHDLVIVLGDFGFYWENNKKSKQNINKLLKQIPYQLAFIPGNHENYALLEIIKINDYNIGIDKFEAGEIWYFPKGYVYNITNKKFFMFGGAESIDKGNRIEHISWWSQELATKREEDLALENLLKANNKVDYILTHTCPTRISNYITKPKCGWSFSNNNYSQKSNDPTCKFLDEIERIIDFQKWFFGHFHDDISYQNYHCLYCNNIKELI